MEQTVTVGDRISQLLSEKHMTQRELSNIINVTEVTVGRYINNSREAKCSTLGEIARALDVSTDYLLNGDSFLPPKDEKDISKKLNNLLTELNNKGVLMFDGKFVDMDDDSRELLRSSLENIVHLTKVLSRQKFTANKYK